METRIKNILHEVAAKEEINILYACESGSRAWGFSSPDSDYDVRFIYVRKETDYLSVSNKKDYLNFPITDELDIYGWDIRKVLQLLLKSNATPFEWLQSPVIYSESIPFRVEMLNLLTNYFCPATQMFHYLGITDGALAGISDGRLKIKKLFYILRPLLAAKWIAVEKSYPPMNIFPLLKTVSLSDKELIHRLIKEKSAVNESFYVEADKNLFEFITNEREILWTYAKNIAKTKFFTEPLNHFFIKCLRK